MAVGGTALTPTSLSIVANLYPQPRERARAIGLWGISSGLGTGLGPIVGGALTEAFGWRSVFVVNAIAGVIALAIVLRVVPRSRSTIARRIDVAGQLLVTGFLATLTYALIEAPQFRLRIAADRDGLRARGEPCSSPSSSSSSGV